MNYDEFRRDYEHQHPASVPVFEREMHEYPSWVQAAVLITFIAAAMVSGVHTVPTVWKGIETGPIITESIRAIVSLAALIMVEFAILLSAYLMIKGSWLAYAGMAVAAAAAIIANLYSVILAFQHGGDGGAVLVAVIMGIAAPLIALLMGKMYVDIHRADRVQDMKAKRAYREACIAWDKEIERAYKLSMKMIVKPAVTTLPISTPPALEPIKQKVGDKILYTCPTCQRQMTRQAWSTHKCREVDTSIDRQLTRQVTSSANGHNQNGHF